MSDPKAEVKGAAATFTFTLPKPTERGAMREPDYRVRFITLRGC